MGSNQLSHLCDIDGLIRQGKNFRMENPDGQAFPQAVKWRETARVVARQPRSDISGFRVDRSVHCH